MKVHAKVCVIKKREKTKTVQYGFVSTGNLHEKTARVYGDHCLLTSNRNIMADINKIFQFLEYPEKGYGPLERCKTLVVSPISMRPTILALINNEIKNAKAGKPAAITIKLNSLSDVDLIKKLNDAAIAGVTINMIVRGIFCAHVDHKKFNAKPRAISIVDEYLEHARVMIFCNGGNEKVFISSADWMVRNIDHRVEAAVPILDPAIKKELQDIIHIQLQDNVKARVLDSALLNNYVPSGQRKKIRSQIETYLYLQQKTNSKK
jgi:polyphosphate kinase